MNNIQILGTITREPELRYTQSGIAILSFGIAYNEKRKQADGNYTDVPHFFDVTAFGKKAETINSWFRKGSRILIQGSLDYQAWEKDGQKKSKVGIKLEDFDFIDKKDSGQSAQPQQPKQEQEYPQNYNQPKHTDYQPREQARQMPDKNSLPDIDIDEELPF